MHVLLALAILPFLALLAFTWLSGLPVGRALIFPIFWVLCGGTAFLFAVAAGWSNAGIGPGLFGIVSGGLLAWYFASIPLWVGRTKQKEREWRVANVATRQATMHSVIHPYPVDRPEARPLALPDRQRATKD